MKSDNEILRLCSITKSINTAASKKYILSDISFRVYTDTLLAIIGPSGSGKTTLAKTLKGYLNYSSGSLFFKGRIGRPKDLLVNPDIQLVFQNPNQSLTPNRIILTYLIEYLVRYKRFSKSLALHKLHHVCDELKIHSSRLSKYPHQLSGGEKQRIALLRALLAEPKLLICDEILSALDQPLQAEVMKTLMSYYQKNTFALLFISHDLSLLSDYFFKAILLSEGKIVQKGNLKDIINQRNETFINESLDSLSWLSN